MEIKQIVEAILFAAQKPMTVKQIQQVFPEIEQPELEEIQTAIETISIDYQPRPIELKQVASGYRFQLKAGLSHWVSRLFEEKPPRYSRALLETLAIIAYRQPVTRGDIEDIRGVSVSSSIIQTLLEREWIRVVAHKEVPGRPGLYGTTKQFLDYFNITSLNELPTLQQIADLDVSVEPQTIQEKREEPETKQRAIEIRESASEIEG
jgi:segregation and condensation protein B